MTNSLGIAAVTVCLRYLIETELSRQPPAGVDEARVYTLRPDRFAANNTAGVNIFLYAVSPNSGWTVNDLPTRSSGGVLTKDPLSALDLHYVITCHGNRTTSELDGQRLLGRVVAALGANPILSQKIVRDAMRAYRTELPYLGDVDLADQFEPVRVSRVVLPVDDMSKLWSLFEQSPYEISVCYTASAVLLESSRDLHKALPVRQREITITGGPFPHITEAHFDPATGRLSLRGTDLQDAQTHVNIGAETVVPVTVSPTEVQAVVPPHVPVGIHPVSVRHPLRHTASNVVAVSLLPVIEQLAVTGEQVTVTPDRPLHAGQRAVVRLSRRPGGQEPAAAPTTRTFSHPPVAPEAAPCATVVIDRADVPDGQWLVCLEVDGLTSGFELENEIYARPAIVVPPS